MAANATSFKAGAEWRGNAAGRPKRETEREYLNAIIGLVSMETWGRIVEKAIGDALDGDKYARDWLSKYLIGEPSLLETDDIPAPIKGFTAAMSDEQLDRYIEKLRAAKSA